MISSDISILMRKHQPPVNVTRETNLTVSLLKPEEMETLQLFPIRTKSDGESIGIMDAMRIGAELLKNMEIKKCNLELGIFGYHEFVVRRRSMVEIIELRPRLKELSRNMFRSTPGMAVTVCEKLDDGCMEVLIRRTVNAYVEAINSSTDSMVIVKIANGCCFFVHPSSTAPSRNESECPHFLFFRAVYDVISSSSDNELD